MKILFFQWRYHTNRHPMVKALKQGNHDVKYISQYSLPEAENHDATIPIVIGYSPIFQAIAKITGRVDGGIRMKYGWPPVRRLWKEMKDFNPDVVIVRNYGFVQAFVLLFGNFLGSGGIIQEQHPKYKKKTNTIKKFLDRVYKTVFNKPLVRVTPIKGDTSEKTSSNVYYVPFPIDAEVYRPFEKKVHFKENKINIISVGDLTSKRKNQIDLLAVFNEILNKYDLNLTLVGHLDDKSNKHYKRIVSYIRDHGLEDRVEIKTNLDHKELQQMYSDFDLFVLPSQDEPAAVSPVEAMAAGLPVICSDTNGTKEYVTHGQNGYIFSTGSRDDLAQKIEMVIQNRVKLIQMSEKSIERVKQEHLPSVYRNRMEKIIAQNFGDH